MRSKGGKKTTNISRKRTRIVVRAEEDTKTRLERNGNDGSPKSFYVDPSLSIVCGAARNAGSWYANFFGMSARARNNFMEISSPAKHSHRVSRASNAIRIEKRGRGEKKSSPCLSYSSGR